MDTENLIALLAADQAPPRKPRLRLRVAAGAVVSLGLMLAFWGLRPGWGALGDQPVMLAKAVWPLALAALAGLLLNRPPMRTPPLWPLAVASAVIVGGWILAVAAGGAVFSGTTVACLISVPLLALPIGAALFAGLGHRVVPLPARTGLVAGLCAGGLSAAIYALHCDEDAASFFLLWYGVGILVCGLAGRVAGRRFLGV
ncbi:NrsF family protein [Citreimonas sp.]|uniref:NrsF family protein n=1 Tax=Citreimonas sp. TaxID=3036715 RepID=UPI0035C836F5